MLFLALTRDEEGGGQKDEAADDEPLPGAGNADHDEHAVEHDDQEHAEDGAEHRARAAGEAGGGAVLNSISGYRAAGGGGAQRAGHRG